MYGCSAISEYLTSIGDMTCSKQVHKLQLKTNRLANMRTWLIWIMPSPCTFSCQQCKLLQHAQMMWRSTTSYRRQIWKLSPTRMMKVCTPRCFLLLQICPIGSPLCRLLLPIQPLALRDYVRPTRYNPLSSTVMNLSSRKQLAIPKLLKLTSGWQISMNLGPVTSRPSLRLILPKLHLPQIIRQPLRILCLAN